MRFPWGTHSPKHSLFLGAFSPLFWSNVRNSKPVHGSQEVIHLIPKSIFSYSKKRKLPRMPKRVTKAYYPRFATFESSKRGDDSLTVASNRKIDLGTYDMEDDHGSIGPLENMTHTSSSSSSTKSSHEITSACKDKLGSHSNTESMSIGLRSQGESSLDVTISFSERKPGEVSYSESEGSTYVSDKCESSVSERLESQVEVVEVIQVCDPVADTSELVASKTKECKIEDDDDGELFDVDLESAQANCKKNAKYNIKRAQISTRVQKPPRSTKTKKMAPVKRKHHAPIPRKNQRKISGGAQLYLDHVEYYSDFEEASINDDISSVHFISKEETHAIFCRRLIPLEIPVQDAEDEISEVSVNDSSVMLSMVAGGNSEKAVHTHQGVPEKNNASEGARTKSDSKEVPLKLSNVKYLAKVDVASDDRDISTVGYPMPYDIARAAFSRVEKVPKNISDSSVTKLFIEIPICPRSGSLSSFDSLSFRSESFLKDEFFGDYGSEDAIRQTREVNNQQTPKLQGKYDDQRKPKTTTTCESEEKHKEKYRKNGVVTSKEHDRKMRKGSPPKARSRPRALDNDKAHVEARHPVHVAEDETSTDARIRELKEKIKSIQSISALDKNYNESAKKSSSRYKTNRDSRKYAGRHNEARTKIGEISAGIQRKEKDLRTSKNPGNSKGGPEKQEAIQSKETRKANDHADVSQRPDHENNQMSESSDPLKLFNVHYLENVEIASNNTDLSTVEVKISKENASMAFGDNLVPLEVPIDDLEDVSTIHYDVEGQRQTSFSQDEVLGKSKQPRLEPDVENGYTRRTSTRYQNSRKGGKEVTIKKIKREIATFIFKTKEGVHQNPGPCAEKIKTELVSFWKKHMDGKSKTEKIVIGMIAFSFFLLLVILIAIVSKKQ